MRPQLEPHGESNNTHPVWEAALCWCCVVCWLLCPHTQPTWLLSLLLYVLLWCVHQSGMDNADSVEGFMAEKAGVMRTKARGSSSNNSSSEPDLLSGLPYRVSSSMSASKDQMLVQVRRACGQTDRQTDRQHSTTQHSTIQHNATQHNTAPYVAAYTCFFLDQSSHALCVLCAYCCACAQGRGELSLYHDLPGLATSTLAADVQTSGAAAAGELQHPTRT